MFQDALHAEQNTKIQDKQPNRETNIQTESQLDEIYVRNYPYAGCRWNV